MSLQTDYYFLSQKHLKELISSLQMAYEAGFGLVGLDAATQAYTPLMNTLIDLTMKLGQLISQENLRRFEALTPELKFSEDFQDALGNPLQLRTLFENPRITTSLSVYFKKLSQNLINILINPTAADDFMSEPEEDERTESPNSRRVNPHNPGDSVENDPELRARRRNNSSRKGYSRRKRNRRTVKFVTPSDPVTRVKRNARIVGSAEKFHMTIKRQNRR